jgi:hypothetical protein
MNQSLSAATDVGEFLTDLDGGQFEHMLSVALSQTAAAVVDHEKTGKVTITLDLERIPGTHQVRIAHTLKYTKPTSLGKTSDEASAATVLHVGKYGALSLAQGSLIPDEKAQHRIPGA